MLQKGSVLAERYVIESELGRGGMGVVYLATQRGLNRLVALKVLLPQLATDTDAAERFVREAQVSSALRHPNAVEIYDFGRDGKRLFLAMQYLEGQPISRLLRDEREGLPLEQTLALGVQLADVLDAAHTLRMVHRDLKPENLFCERWPDGTDRLIVVDFGLAFIEAHEALGRLTKAGILHGTPAYAAPEQIRGGEVGPAADIYSFGVLLYELSCGQLPFSGGDVQLVTKHLFEQAEPPRQRFPERNIPRALDDLIMRMMRKRSTDRPLAGDIRRVLEGIRTAAAEESVEGGRQKKTRAQRAVGGSSQEALAPENTAQRMKSLSLGGAIWVHGELPADLSNALKMNGFNFVEGPGDAEVILALEAPDYLIPELLEQGPPVVVDVETGNMDSVARMLRMGVAQVVTRPIAMEDALRVLRRTVKKARRRK